MMAVTEDIRALILERASVGRMRYAARQQGMKGLREDGWRLVRDGRTTIEEVAHNTMDEQHALGKAPADDAVGATGNNTGAARREPRAGVGFENATSGRCERVVRSQP